jgi:hypothetical protein
MKFSRVVNSHDISEELFEDEIALINQAVNARRSHLRSIDELDRRDIAPKQRKSCPTNKRKFKDKTEAEYVLHKIMNNRKEALATGKHYRFAQFRSYKCSCGYFHHSSRPELGQIEVSNVA